MRLTDMIGVNIFWPE